MNWLWCRDCLVSGVLIAANAALAGLMAYVILGPNLALLVAGAVAFSALMMPGVNSRAAVQRFGGQQLPPDHWLSRVVAVLAERANLPKVPAVYLLPNRVPNAMALGNGIDGSVAVTAGAMELLPDDELSSVLAHEVSHLRHGDTRLLAISAMSSRVTGVLAQIMMFFTFLSLPFVLTGAVKLSLLWLAVIFLAPWLAAALQMALSRRREFAADRSAGELTGQPLALARALQRLDGQTQNYLPPWLKPYVGRQHPWLLSHPPTPSRVEALQVQPENHALPPLPTRGQWQANPIKRGVTTLLRILRGW